MADIKLDIDVSSIAKAKKALKDFSNQSDKLGRSVMAAGKKVQSVSSGWAEANKMYKQGVLNSKQLSQAQVELARELAVINGYTKKNGSLNTDRALRELKAAEAAKDNARATQEAADAARKQAREIDRLKGKFVANYGASQKYKKEIRDLIRAKRQGIITTDQYGDAVQRLKSDFRDVPSRRAIRLVTLRCSYRVAPMLLLLLDNRVLSCLAFLGLLVQSWGLHWPLQLLSRHHSWTWLRRRTRQASH